MCLASLKEDLFYVEFLNARKIVNPKTKTLVLVILVYPKTLV